MWDRSLCGVMVMSLYVRDCHYVTVTSSPSAQSVDSGETRRQSVEVCSWNWAHQLLGSVLCAGGQLSREETGEGVGEGSRRGEGGRGIRGVMRGMMREK